MLYPEFRDLGAFVRWVMKGCKTKLNREVLYHTDQDWENYVIGLLIVFLPGLIAILLLCLGIIR
jgi:hypothetical protein